MEGTYRRIEPQIETRPDSLQRLAKQSLTWVLYAKRRLNQYELCEAVSFEPSAEPREDSQSYTLKDIFDACCSLLYLEDNIVRPIHYSVKEYFTPSHSRMPMRATGIVDHARAASAYLATTCLSYLLYKGLGQMPYRDMINLVMGKVVAFPLCYYAAWYFDEHVVEADHRVPDLDELLCAFLNSSAVRLATVLQLRYLQLTDFSPSYMSLQWIKAFYTSTKK